MTKAIHSGKTNETAIAEKTETSVFSEKAVSITEYVETEMRSFAEKPFTEVDSLVLSQFSYLNFESAVPGDNCTDEAVPLYMLYRAEKFAEFTDSTLTPKHNLQLLKAICASPRFRNIKVSYYVNHIDHECEMQFCAMTFFLTEGHIYVAYRGTDTTINGWKEDFNMFFMDVIPGQVSAVDYLHKAAAMTEGGIYVGGHSKGGNLAVYAASFAGEEIQNRITAVFNHDGPGLTKGAVARDDYRDIQHKTNVTLPHYSLVGMIFCRGEYSVVDSDRIGILQHDPFSWQIVNGNFVYEEKVKGGANRLLDGVYELMDTLSMEDRQIFVDTVFDIINSAGATTFSDFPLMAIQGREKVLQAMKDISPDTSDKLKNVITELIKILARQNFRMPENEITTKLNDTLSKLSARTEIISEKLTERVNLINETTDNIREAINTGVMKAREILKMEDTPETHNNTAKKH